MIRKQAAVLNSEDGRSRYGKCQTKESRRSIWALTATMIGLNDMTRAPTGEEAMPLTFHLRITDTELANIMAWLNTLE